MRCGEEGHDSKKCMRPQSPSMEDELRRAASLAMTSRYLSLRMAQLELF